MIEVHLKRRAMVGLMFCVAVGGAVHLLKMSAEQGLLAVMPTMTMLLAAGWIVFSGTRWWLLLPGAVAFGGTLVLSHKFHTHEMMLPIVLIAAVPVVVTGGIKLERRTPLPWVAIGLIVLFVGEWVASIYLSEWRGVGGFGSITRAYFNGLWALLFVVAFYWFGKSSVGPLLKVLYVMYAIRGLLCGLSAYYGGIFQVVKEGFAVGGSIGLQDFRVSGVQLVLLSWGFAQSCRTVGLKAFNYSVMVVSIGLVALSGGRVTLGLICVVPLAWAVMRRRFGWVAFVGAVLLTAVLLLNKYPDVVYQLPEQMQRAASVLVRESSTSSLVWHDTVRLSNQWHQRLGEIGFERWTSSIGNFFFGHRVNPYDDAYEAYSTTMEIMAQVAADLGLYEAGLWNVLGLLGAAGLWMYGRLFWFLMVPPLRELREHGVRDYAGILYFMATMTLMMWVAFSWIYGSFPSYELMLAVFARAAWEDGQQKSAEVAGGVVG